MSEQNTGGFAFPQNTKIVAAAGQELHQGFMGGISIRDYFAAKAPTEIFDVSFAHAKQLVGRECPIYIEDPKGFAEFWADCRAVLRYIEADAMLKARKA